MIKISKKFNSVIKRYIVIAFEYNLEIRILKIYLRKEKIGSVFDKYIHCKIQLLCLPVRKRWEIYVANGLTCIFPNKVFTSEFVLFSRIVAEVAIIPRETRVSWRTWNGRGLHLQNYEHATRRKTSTFSTV